MPNINAHMIVAKEVARKLNINSDYLNSLFVNKYELDIDKLENILSQYDCKILKEKLKYIIGYLKQKKDGKTKYLNFDSFASFLLEVPDTISKELLDYANKSSKLYIRIR